ncbi:PREDICTED: proline synthase co-transcribed bacterial homolog protein [Ceratosolen solmsi marchali]|uniref:Pyridoxal phosphate homeostasis protein n=1 Tax=Ceratosolen solmsi marchali TaxID=326594 RepID=A0AAJ6YFF4_9HYME|nr:PREDICTED: proline synthase co-transcribed bacterial homolog protein [Ceratosolen solmsi marchali]
MADISYKLKTIHNKILAASAVRSLEDQCIQPHLIAVSKHQPIEAIITAYEVGQRHFGENYINELSKKANSNKILEKCLDIKWHLIGHVQTNNINKLLKVPNLDVIETVNSEKIAIALNNAWEKFRKIENSKLKIMIQVNTSKELAKSGCDINNVSSVVKYILDKCPCLQFLGLMTIGKFGYDLSKGPNPDFLTLKKCKDKICDELSIHPRHVKLSMGMSADFEHAIEIGSSYIRVGTAIFGERPATTTN